MTNTAIEVKINNVVTKKLFRTFFGSGAEQVTLIPNKLKNWFKKSKIGNTISYDNYLYFITE